MSSWIQQYLKPEVSGHVQLNEPIKIFSLKPTGTGGSQSLPSLQRLEFAVWTQAPGCPEEPEAEGEKAEGCQGCPVGSTFQPKLGHASAVTGQQVILSKTPESGHPSQTQV